MMKLAALLFSCSVSNAFTGVAVVARIRTISSTPLFAASSTSTARPDASKAIQAALEATKQFGATSPEARIAWEAVEDLDSTDNSAAYSPSLDNECLTEEEISKACVDYGDKLEQLHSMIGESVPKMQAISSLAQDMKSIKLAVSQAKPGADSPELRSALETAKMLSDKFGPSSAEAKIAWSEVEEIASTGLNNAMGVRLDEECLVESAMEACLALEELSRALNLYRTRAEGLADF